MYSKSCIIIFCLTINAVFAQQQNIDRIDSLQKTLLTSFPDTNRVKILAKLADIHTNFGSAFIYAQQGIDLAKKINFLKGEADCFLSMGNAYSSILDEFKANECFQKSEKIFRKLQDKAGIWNAAGGNARIFYLEKDFRRELLVHLKLEKISKEFNSIDMLLSSLANIGSTYHHLGQLDSAEMYLRRGYAISNQSRSDRHVGYVTRELGDVLCAAGKNEEALYYLHKTLELSLKINDQNSIGETYFSLAQTYTNKSQIDSAFFYAKKSYDLAKHIHYDSLDRITITANLLSLLYESKGNYREALYFKKIATAAQDSSSAQERVSKLSAFADRENQRELEKIAAENEYRKSVFLYASFIGIIVFFLIAVTLYRNNRQKQKAFVELKATQAQLIQSEKAASLGKLQQAVSNERLRISSELHDEVGASLSSISIFSQAAIQKNESGNITDSKSILERIGETSREVMGELNDTVWLINPGNDNLQKVIQRITNYALPLCTANNIHFEIKAAASVENLDLSVDKRKAIYLIIKEAVNNSLKYAAARNLTIQFEKNDKALHISIKDDGVGFDDNNPSAGNGLNNMKQRAKDVHGKIDFHSAQQKGTDIILQVPLTNIGD